MQGPAPSPHMSLPSTLVFSLTGHEGPVLNIRFNPKGTYCISCGKVCC
jgi:mitogen-activated protein kinase organizer 1